MPTTAVAPRSRPYVRARHRIALGLGAEPADVGRARREVRGCLAEWRLSAAADSVLLVLSELVSNALRHAPCPVIGLIVTVGEGEFLVEVRDGSRRPPVMDPGSDPYGESGRGLPLVQALSRDWGWTPHDDGTKTTWAVLPAPAEPPAHSTTTTEGFLMADYVPAPLPVCGARRLLPDPLVAVAGAFAPRGTADAAHVERDLRCVLQAHTAGEHHAYVMHLEGRDTGSVWARWDHDHDHDQDRDGARDRDGTAPTLTVLPDCRVPAPEPLDEACCQFAGHPGGHCYDLDDPWHPTTVPAAAVGPSADLTG